MPDPAQPAQPEGFDQVLSSLRALVERLEGGNLSLEQSLASFEEGVRLSRRGAQILDTAEQRVELLLKREDGSDATAPFEPGPGGASSPKSDGTEGTDPF